jgi:hypothetical protein
MPAIIWDIRSPANYDWAVEIARREYTSALERAGEGLRAAIARQYVLDNAVASGKTAKSFQVSDVVDYGDRMGIFVAPTGDRASVAAWLEEGTDPSANRPSPEAVNRIMQWMRSRRIASSASPGKKRAIAFAIGKTVLESGLYPREIIAQAEDHYDQYINQIFEGATRRIARQINDRLERRR